MYRGDLKLLGSSKVKDERQNRSDARLNIIRIKTADIRSRVGGISVFDESPVVESESKGQIRENSGRGR